MQTHYAYTRTEDKTMVAMPYILVNMVLDVFSLVFFCLTSAAVLSRYRFAGLWLPAPVRRQKILAVVAQMLALLFITILAVRMTSRFPLRSIVPPFVSLPPALGDAFTAIGLINLSVLGYRFMARRYLLNASRVLRSIVLGTIAAGVSLAFVLAVVIAAFGMFTIR